MDAASCEGRASLIMRQLLKLAFEPGGMPDTVDSGSSVSQPITVFNPSCGTVKNVQIRLDMDGVICAAVYIDRILPGEQVEKELKMLITEFRGINRYGETSGTFTVTYEDSNGVQRQITPMLKNRISESETLTDSEKAALEKEEMQRNTLSKWWISTPAAVAVIAILASVLIVSRLARVMKRK